MSRITALFIILLFSSFTTSSYAALITNGSFELATTDPGSRFTTLAVGSTSVSGWTVTQEPIHYIGTYWEATDGIRSIDLDAGPGQVGGIEQTFATTPGNEYTVSFDMSGNPDGGPTIKPMRVVADGQSTDVAFDISGNSRTDMGYEARTWTFTADDSVATLQFLSLNEPGGNFGPVIDNVAVNAIPIPASFLLFGSGLLGLVAVVRKKVRLEVRHQYGSF